jgi:alpha-amylase
VLVSIRCAVLGGAVLLACAGAPTAHGRVDAQAAAKGQERLGHFSLTRLGATPARVQAGRSFTVSGRVRNAPGRRAQTARVTFTLRARRTTRTSRWIRLDGTNIRRTKGGASRRFAERVRVPATVLPARYFFFACVRRGSGTLKASCKSRRITVTPAPAGGGTPGGGTPGGGTPGGGGTPADPFPGLRSLRAPLTGENFYFVMADRFANGDTGNDDGDIPGGRLQHGYDPTHKGFYHGGDLKGMLREIDYIQGLGTTAIWLTPSFKNKPVQGPSGQETAGYHGYWITDFTQIDPHLGTNADLRALVDAAHGRGMKVFFDIITNHTADVIGYEQKAGGPAPYGYVSKDDVPYRDAAGNPFDDRDHAGTAGFPALSPETSFPYRPFNPPGSGSPGNVNHKVPEWLNDLTAYHNRGDTSFTGENSYYGDFFGLDDLFTEDPRVLRGMTDIYKAWVDFGVDGFRIDTMKHVNDEFWQQFAPDVLAYARARGKQDFMMFGEVFDTTKTFTSHFTTRDRVQAVLDFPFQAAAQGFAANSGPTSALRDFFAGDDWYTDADSNAYQLPTFLGNHDMGRIGLFIRQAGAAPPAEDLARDKLAHELMYFSRGNPVVYYGDEQGFVGDGGDQDARQDMFRSAVGTYRDDVEIGRPAADDADHYDRTHPLYQVIAELARVTKAHPALRNGVQQHRLASGGAGIYAFSRLDRTSQREYVVALNNAEQPREANVPTAAGAGAPFELVYGTGAAASATDSSGSLPVVVPPLSAVVYRSGAAIPRSGGAPNVAVGAEPDGDPARDRVEVQAFVDGASFYDVTFYAKVADGAWAPVGTDDNAPYRVFHDVADVEPGTRVQYRAVVLDNAGNSRASSEQAVTVAEPSIAMTGPADGARVRGTVALSAEAVPDRNHYSVTFERSVAGGAWTAVGTDGSQPVYAFEDDIDGIANGAEVRYRAVLTYAAGRTVTSAPRSTTVVSDPVTTAIVHYKRPAGDYADWGLHLWGDGKAGPDTAWDAPRQRDGVDGYGAFFNIPLANDTRPVNFIVHRPSGDSVPTTREPGGDRSFVPLDHPEIWLEQGDPTIYYSPPPP